MVVCSHLADNGGRQSTCQTFAIDKCVALLCNGAAPRGMLKLRAGSVLHESVLPHSSQLARSYLISSSRRHLSFPGGVFTSEIGPPRRPVQQQV